MLNVAMGGTSDGGCGRGIGEFRLQSDSVLSSLI